MNTLPKERIAEIRQKCQGKDRITLNQEDAMALLYAASLIHLIEEATAKNSMGSRSKKLVSRDAKSIIDMLDKAVEGLSEVSKKNLKVKQ